MAAQLHRMIRDARLLADEGGREICGFLIDNGYFIEMIRLKNKKRSGGGFSFYLREADLIEKACKAMKHDIVGTFHSHPCYIAKPGDSDIAGAYDDELILIIDVMKNQARLWRISNHQEKELHFELI